jgi:Ni2+-binding GTPase involved in maturation of urease and hydrogenase
MTISMLAHECARESAFIENFGNLACPTSYDPARWQRWCY